MYSQWIKSGPPYGTGHSGGAGGDQLVLGKMGLIADYLDKQLRKVSSSVSVVKSSTPVDGGKGIDLKISILVGDRDLGEVFKLTKHLHKDLLSVYIRGSHIGSIKVDDLGLNYAKMILQSLGY